jgi:ABC-type transporter Mla MlaB component
MFSTGTRRDGRTRRAGVEKAPIDRSRSPPGSNSSLSDGFYPLEDARRSNGSFSAPRRSADDFSRGYRSFTTNSVYDQTTITFGIRGPLARSDLPGLCDRVCTLLDRSHATVALCDVSGIAADAVAVDALARLQLAAHRHGCQVRLRQSTPALRDLVAFMGLADVLAE